MRPARNSEKCAAAADSAQTWRRPRARLSSRRIQAKQATATLLRVLRAVGTDTARKGESSTLSPLLFSFPLFFFITGSRSSPFSPSPQHQQKLSQSGSASRSFWLMRPAVLAMEDRKRSVPHEPSDDPAPPLKRQALQSSSSSNQQNSHQLPQSQEDVIVSCPSPHPLPVELASTLFRRWSRLPLPTNP